MRKPAVDPLILKEVTRGPSQGTIDEDDVLRATDTSSAPAFQLERYTNVAIKMLSLDPNLAKVHSRLISRMPEKTFWHHYFSRVADLRAEVGLEPLCEDLRQVINYLGHLTALRH